MGGGGGLQQEAPQWAGGVLQRTQLTSPRVLISDKGPRDLYIQGRVRHIEAETKPTDSLRLLDSIRGGRQATGAGCPVSNKALSSLINVPVSIPASRLSASGTALQDLYSSRLVFFFSPRARSSWPLFMPRLNSRRLPWRISKAKGGGGYHDAIFAAVLDVMS